MSNKAAYRQHPLYSVVVERFKIAHAMWLANPNVQQIARLMGIDHYTYCCVLVAQMGPLIWTTTNTTNAQDIQSMSFSDAYFEAMRETP